MFMGLAALCLGAELVTSELSELYEDIKKKGKLTSERRSDERLI